MTEKFVFVKKEELGICECCNKEVFNNTLYVKEGEKYYHFSCYNIKKAEENK